MQCQRCKSERIASVSAKCSDLCTITIGETEHDGDVPEDLMIGGGDYIEFDICLDCGQLQGDFPLQPSTLEDEI